MATGVNAGRHGIWDFSERDETGYRLRLVNGSYSRAPAVWTRLSAAGRRVEVFHAYQPCATLCSRPQPAADCRD